MDVGNPSRIEQSHSTFFILLPPKNYIKYALFTHKNIFERLKTRKNKGENYI